MRTTFTELQDICGHLQPCVEGWTCRHKNNLSKVNSSWGACNQANCPVVIRENVNGSVYINENKIGTFNSISFS